MGKTCGLTDAIRDVLNAADDSLTARQVIDALCAADVEFCEGSVASLLRQRAMAGEFIKGEIDGQQAFTVNPEFVGRAKKTRKQVEPQPKPTLAPAPKLTAPPDMFFPAAVVMRIPQLTGAADFNARAAAGDAVIEDGDRELVAQVASVADIAPTPAPPRATANRPPLALAERLAAIASDIEDVIGDACDARLPHALIKALTVASGATHRAAKALA